MRCIFSCLGDKKSSKKPNAIPSKDQDHGAYQIIMPIEMISVKGENTKLPIIHSQVKYEDHLNGVVKKRVASDFTNITAQSKSYSKKKKEERQKTEQNRSLICQARSGSSMSSLFSYPLNNKYKNNSSRDDDHGFAEQESSDSLFSISVNSKKQSEKEEKEVNSPMKIRECPEKEKRIILNPIEKTTRLNAGNLEKLVMMDDQEEKENVKEYKETSLPFSSENIFKQRLNFSGAEKETEIISADHSTEIKSNIEPIENLVQSNAGKLGGLILMDERKDKEDIKAEQEILKQKSNFSEENKIMRSNIGVKTVSLLSPIKNITQWNTGESRRFNLKDDQEEKEIINSDQDTRVPFICQETSFRKSSECSEKMVKEVLVDTSLSSWLVETERESDSPKSVKNSPVRESYPLRRYNDDYNQNEKDRPIVGYHWKVFGVLTQCQHHK